MALLANKDWDRHVADAEEVARGGGFRSLRDQILERAEPSGRSTVVDVGSGTGLLTLAFAEHCDRVWAVDISAGMAGYLRAKAASAGLENVEPVVASAVSLPLVDCSADLVVSNYCFHHLRNADKVRALEETQRVLRPGGTLVFGDMMFSPGLRDTRDRQVISAKVRALLRKGPAGAWRLLRNAVRLASARWEKPVRPEWWRAALEEAGFVEVRVEALAHEGGIAFARKPG